MTAEVLDILAHWRQAAGAADDVTGSLSVAQRKAAWLELREATSRLAAWCDRSDAIDCRPLLALERQLAKEIRDDAPSRRLIRGLIKGRQPSTYEIARERERESVASEAWELVRRIEALTRHPEPEVKADKPSWDADRSELSYAGAVVRKIKPTAQACGILAAFEEEGWPVRIYSPLPPEQDLTRVLRTLNDRLSAIRFRRDGTGDGIRWEEVSRN